MKTSNRKFNRTNFLTALIMLCSLSFSAVANELSWQVKQLPNEPSLRGSAMVDGKMWVTGTNKSVFISEDQGNTWLDKSVNTEQLLDFRDIEVFDKQTAIIMSVGSGKDSKLLKTTDGGDSWHLLYQNEDEQGFFDSIGFWDNQVGLLLGDPVDGYYVVKKTQDGGKTWRRIAKTKLPLLLNNEAAFAASGNTLLVGEQGKAWITTGGFSASVYVSHDWGESWQRQSVPLYQATQTAGGYGLALNHHQQLFVLGGDYQQRPKAYANIARFEKQWQLVNAGQRGLRTAMSCSERLCIATGKTGSDLSFDQGKKWQAFDNENAEQGDKGFYTLANEGEMFIAAGAKGKVGVIRVKP
ncbi:WD40/YVTN/BNR-like repeat-containing protein [Thalassotalea hakodatensis]|uniref:WD40/YVTN/BNR-like repeat-containing protein n=1 Tax=Thalassotalea hakodatensis TaxID=3030492 RepID=UPI0025746B8F|nr:YCF48-related protein [Thalassotalea hakodatensis]